MSATFRRRPAGAAPLATLLLWGLGCGDGSAPGKAAAPVDTLAAPPPGAAAAAPASSARAERPFAGPIVVFMEASTGEIEAARGKMSEEEFHVMADDLSFYRSSAWDYLEKRGIPMARVSGRQPLSFVLDGAPRTFDFAQEPTLDLLVVFDGKHPPRAVAPIDVQAVDTLFPSPGGR